MATFNKGILGGFSGKVGEVIGYRSRGKNIMRSVASRYRDRRSYEQLMVRARFKELVAISTAMAPAIQVGMKLRARAAGNSEANSFFKANWPNVWYDPDGLKVVEYEKMVFCAGPLMSPSFKSAKCEDLELSVAFDTDSEVPRTDGKDEVYVAVYQPRLKQGVIGEVATRSSGKAEVRMPVLWSGTEVHVYGFAVGGGSQNLGMRSNTVYIGKVVVE